MVDRYRKCLTSTASFNKEPIFNARTFDNRFSFEYTRNKNIFQDGENSSREMVKRNLLFRYFTFKTGTKTCFLSQRPSMYMTTKYPLKTGSSNTNSFFFVVFYFVIGQQSKSFSLIISKNRKIKSAFQL